mmetsp:Transcript_5863/g.15289  ORF Transcript_5863/g.15289 Transcript_5863/m.15289 type:complete len:200 (-) Transcript_5863:9-608(-)
MACASLCRGATTRLSSPSSRSSRGRSPRRPLRTCSSASPICSSTCTRRCWGRARRSTSSSSSCATCSSRRCGCRRSSRSSWARWTCCSPAPTCLAAPRTRRAPTSCKRWRPTGAPPELAPRRGGLALAGACAGMGPMREAVARCWHGTRGRKAGRTTQAARCEQCEACASRLVRDGLRWCTTVWVSTWQGGCRGTTSDE